MNTDFYKEVEESVLGGCMIDVEAYLSIDTILKPEDFYIVSHQMIFNAITNVYNEKQTVDPVLVAEKLKDEGNLNRVGGTDYIYELIAKVVETESTVHYGHIVKEESLKRQRIAFAAKITEQANDETSKISDIDSELIAYIDNMDSEIADVERFTSKDLVDMQIEPVKWIVPDLIPDGLTVLAGAAKVGKSFLALNLGFAVAMQGRALSNIQIEEKRNVLYIALEDPKALLQERMKMLLDCAPPDNFHFIDDMKNYKFDPAGLRVIEKHIDETNAELLIVDTWRHVCPENSAVSGTSYDTDYAKLIPVQSFAHRKNIGIVLITHTRKSPDPDNVFNQVQGSMGIQAGCDTLMMLTKTSDTHSLHVSGRRIQPEEYAMVMDNGIWSIEGSAEEYNQSAARVDIFDILDRAGPEGMKAKDIALESDRKEDAIYKILRKMVNDGQILQPKERGPYLHKKHVYDL